jgi:hypothetical protein
VLSLNCALVVRKQAGIAVYDIDPARETSFHCARSVVHWGVMLSLSFSVEFDSGNRCVRPCSLSKRAVVAQAIAW